MLQFNCRHCGKAIRLREEFAGRRGTCPHCKRPIQAPGAAAAPQSAYIPVADVYEEAAGEEPLTARHETMRSPRGSRKEQQPNLKPLVIGVSAGAGVLVLGLVIWLVARGFGKGQNDAQMGGTPAPRVTPSPVAGSQPVGSGPAKPRIQTTPTGAARTDMFSYLPVGLETMAGVRIAESLKSEEKALVKAQLDSSLQPVLSQTGLNLDQLDEVVLGSGAEADDLLVAVRTVKPVDVAELRKSLGCTAGPQKLNQFELYPLRPEADTAESVACFMDPRTFLYGSKDLVQRTLESATGAQRPAVLKTVTEVAGVQTHLWVVARMSALSSQVMQLTSWGVSEGIFKSSLDKIRQVAIGFDLSRAMQLRVAMECGSEGEAKSVRGATDSLRAALRDAEKKEAARRSEIPGRSQSGDEDSGSSGGGSPSSGGGMPPGSPGGRGMPQSGPGGRGMPGVSSSGGMPSGMPGGPGGDSSPGAIWEATEVKQTGKQVVVTLPPVKVESEIRTSPLDVFGSATQLGFARTAIGSSLFPGSLKRTSGALRKLEQQEGSIPSGTVVVEKYPRAVQRISWLASLLPYLGEQDLHDQIDFAEQWTEKRNLPVAATIVDAFLDPLVPQRRWKGLPFEGVALTHFVGMGGVGPEAPRLSKEHPKAGVFGYDRKTALADIRDGVSNTIMMIQVRDIFGPWIEGGGSTVRAAQSHPYIGSTGGFGSPGDGGAMAIFADGSVRFLAKDIDSGVFEALCTINGGEVVDLAKVLPPPKPSLASTSTAPPTAQFDSAFPGAVPASSKPVTNGSAGSDLAVYEKPDGGFALGVPAAWKEIVLDPQKLEPALKTLEQQIPQLGPQLSAAARTAATQGAKLFAFDPESLAAGTMRMVNVTRTDLSGPLTLDQVVEQNVRLLESVPFVVKPVKHERVKMGPGEAERLQYGFNFSIPGGPAIKSDVIQYCLLRRQRSFLITLNIPAGEGPQYLSLAENIAQSFRFLD